MIRINDEQEDGRKWSDFNKVSASGVLDARKKRNERHHAREQDVRSVP